jgi:hypothetical protein
MDRNKQLSGSELAALAEQMIEAATEAEKIALEEKLIRGFYGGDPPPSPAATSVE